MFIMIWGLHMRYSGNWLVKVRVRNLRSNARFLLCVRPGSILSGCKRIRNISGMKPTVIFFMIIVYNLGVWSLSLKR